MAGTCPRRWTAPSSSSASSSRGCEPHPPEESPRGRACAGEVATFFDGLADGGRTVLPVPLLPGGVGNLGRDPRASVSREQFAPYEREVVAGLGCATVTRAVFDEIRRCGSRSPSGGEHRDGGRGRAHDRRRGLGVRRHPQQLDRRTPGAEGSGAGRRPQPLAPGNADEAHLAARRRIPRAALQSSDLRPAREPCSATPTCSTRWPVSSGSTTERITAQPRATEPTSPARSSSATTASSTSRWSVTTWPIPAWSSPGCNAPEPGRSSCRRSHGPGHSNPRPGGTARFTDSPPRKAPVEAVHDVLFTADYRGWVRRGRGRGRPGRGGRCRGRAGCRRRAA